MTQWILSIDQGTTSSRAMLFDANGRSQYIAQQEFTQYFPADGWVEHNPQEIWTATLEVTEKAVGYAHQTGRQLAAIGITNQRETTLVWDRATGQPLYNAIVWQDRRTADICADLKRAGAERTVSDKTGLVLDPYFSGTKLAWILDNVSGARDKAARGDLAFGTVDSFLIWRLTGGRRHLTDATNASRTLLFNIHEQTWDEELLRLFRIPESVLPEVLDCAADFGTTDPEVLGQAIPIAGIAGDQQAALIGQACFGPGMIKSTYGTGCFVILNTGDRALASSNQLLTTIGYRLGGQVTYAIEGSIFVAGAAVQWLRDQLRLIESAPQTEPLASGLTGNAGVYMVPAFTGLGAPYWDPEARGAIFGLTRDTGVAQFARAALESVCYQTADLLQAMRDDGRAPLRLRVDGGMVENEWLCQFLANVLGIPVEKPVETETTALGAAYLAGLQCGIFESLPVIAAHWQEAKRFEVSMTDKDRQTLLDGWHRAVSKVRTEQDPV